jgi:DNA polymerase-1
LRIAIIDIETDPIPATKIHCIVTREIDSSEHKVFLYPFDDFKRYAKTVDLWVAHNGIGFDIPVLNRLLHCGISYTRVVDTFVVSRTVNYPSYDTHGLDEIGKSFGMGKIPFEDFSQLTPEMIEYCKHDVDVTHRVYKRYAKYIWDEKWSKALRVEHDAAEICRDMQENGFMFDSDKARGLLSSITARMAELEAEFQSLWPPQLVEVNRLKYRVKQDGTLYANVANAYGSYPSVQLVGNELVCYDYKPFNPGSPKQRVEKLWEAGWEPTEKTKTHYKFSQSRDYSHNGKKLTREEWQEKKDYFAYYGWTVSEENLATLPESAPEAAQKLAEWLTLEGRRSSLVEWIESVGEDGRIHGKFWHIGAWTHRKSHSNPNSANISAAFHGEPKNGVELVKAEYDGLMRSCWCVPDDCWLVGTDAEGIQLRILAHYLKNDDYVHAIVEGRKENETDIHNVNKRALGLSHITRDDAKTFIYAHILGAGLAKTSRILRTPQNSARHAVSEFQANLGLDVLRKGIIARDARRGYFDGLDGRKVICNSEHLMLAGYLQNGESVIMKHANRLWRQWADEAGINYKQVNDVHDEWQTEVKGSRDEAEALAELQRQSIEQTGRDLNVYCPLAGSSSIGKNWYETH